MTDVESILRTLMAAYERKRSPDVQLTVEINLVPGGDSWTVVIPKNGSAVLLRDGGPAPEIHLFLTQETLADIQEGRITGLTAAGRENLSDPAPLDFALPEGQTMTADLMNRILQFIQRFFNPTLPERIILDKAHARLVHGAHALPMFYATGFRSAWYQIEKGQQLNKAGDTNPFPQGFVFINGSGYAKIGDKTIPVHPGLALHIPPDTEHIVWTENETPLTLIFLAWGKGA